MLFSYVTQQRSSGVQLVVTYIITGLAYKEASIVLLMLDKEFVVCCVFPWLVACMNVLRFPCGSTQPNRDPRQLILAFGIQCSRGRVVKAID